MRSSNPSGCANKPTRHASEPITVELTRGTGTRAQDKLIAKAKGRTLEDARDDMNDLREYLRDLANNARAIQADSTSVAETDE